MDTKGTIFSRHPVAHTCGDCRAICHGWLHCGADNEGHLPSLGVSRAGISILVALVLLATMLGVAHAATNIINTVAGPGLQGMIGDGGPATSASLNNPIGVALDSHGNFFIADGYNRIRRVD